MSNNKDSLINLPQQVDETENKDINELIRNRVEKLQEFRAQGTETYGDRYVRTNLAADILDNFGDFEDRPVALAGRMVARRGHGKAGFANIQDSSGKIQIYVRLNDIGPEGYNLFTKLDIGDFIGVAGKVFKTRMGEVTVAVEKLNILAKSLRPLPEKWHGLKDVDLRYRQRYVEIGRAHV